MAGIVLDIIHKRLTPSLCHSGVGGRKTKKENTSRSLVEVCTSCCDISEEGHLIQSGAYRFCGKLFGGVISELNKLYEKWHFQC